MKGLLEDKSCLIIVPPTLISNWENEIKKFTPDLTYYIYHGSNRTFPLESYDIILTSYGVVRLDLDMFVDEMWFLCVIDEAQNIKNPDTAQTLAIKMLKSDVKIAMTGTPVENRLTELWSIFDFLLPNYLGSYNDFKTKDNDEIEVEGTKYFLKRWFVGKECDIHREKDVLDATANLAKIHLALRGFKNDESEGLCVTSAEDLRQEFFRHNREMKKVRTFMRDKVDKGEFEHTFLKHFDAMYAKADFALERLKNSNYEELLEDWGIIVPADSDAE